MAFKMAGWSGYQKNSSALTKTYEEAYKDRDMKTYGNLTQAEYTTEAKRQNKVYKETGKWDAPSSQMKGSLNQKPESKTITTERPGGGKKKVYTNPETNYQSTTKTRKDDTVKKRKSDMDITNPDSTKFKQKYDKEGNLRKEKMIHRTGYSNLDIEKVGVKKTKYDKEGNVRKEVTRTRKKGGTGIGQAIKDTIARKRKKRQDRKANK
jgi:hypothetical protein